MKVGHNNKDQLFCMNTPPTPPCSTITFSGPIWFKWIHPANKLRSGKLSHSTGELFLVF